MSLTHQLPQLFDYQRFADNPRLRALIDETERRCARSLSDDELEWVSAAGEATAPREAPDDDDRA